MEHARMQLVPKENITSFDTATLEEFDQKSTLFNTMTKSKSFNKIPKHRALYHAFMESMFKDEDAIDKGVADKLKKRNPYDADKDEGPSTGSDRGLKRQRISKGTKSSKKMSTSKAFLKGKFPTTFSKSDKSAKEQVEEPIFVQDSEYAKHDDAKFDNTDMPMDQGEYLGKTNEQPNNEAVPKNDWYKKSRSDTSPNPEWNKGKLVDDGPEQSWLNDLAKATKPLLTFDELMHPLIDFSAFAMNRPVYNLLKGTCKSYVELDYTIEECYRALSKQLDWNNPKVDFFFNNDLEYLRGGSNDKKYTASTTNSKAARTVIHVRVEDLQLGVESYQKKFNLTKLKTRDYVPQTSVYYSLKPLSHEEEAIEHIGSAKDPHHDQNHQSKAAG
uniref:Uncharacterized protein n=1 Tax=Tanacetum cinerariifolium TaxID=118510 RepID=A0A6L2LJK9_TANCI|nr:hypothetical protein [Tanacetum cinerariifolium]